MRIFASMFLFSRRTLRRIKMLILRPNFKAYGKNFIFDPDGYYSFETIVVGDDVFIGHGASLNASVSKIVIGSKVMLAPNVSIRGGDHNTSVVGKFMKDIKDKREEDDQAVFIEDDVWIGTGVIILKGVRIGRGSIIGAGSVVTKDVSPYSITLGVPARTVSYRFGIETILEHETKLYPAHERISVSELRKHREIFE